MLKKQGSTFDGLLGQRYAMKNDDNDTERQKLWQHSDTKRSCTQSDYENVISKTTLTMKNVWQDAQYGLACQVSGVLLPNSVQPTKI